jgi:prophage endopeptidase
MIRALIVAALVAAVLGGIAWYGSGRYDAGEAAERAEWTKRENAELTTANAKILKLTNEARATETRHAADLVAIATRYEKEKTRVLKQTQADVAAVRAGTLVLRDPGRTARQDPGRDPGGATATAASVGDGAAGSQLSSTSAEFLLELANEADAVVVQLTAAQEVIRAAMEACGVKPSQ